MGYYSERIKGSPMQKWIRKAIWVTIGLNVLMGIAVVYSPGMQRMVKVAEGGYFDDSPEETRKKINMQMQLRVSPFFNLISKEDYEKQAAKKRDDLLNNPGDTPN